MGVVEHRRGIVVIDFDHHLAAAVGKKVSPGSIFGKTLDAKIEVFDIPASHRLGIGNVESDVFDFHQRCITQRVSGCLLELAGVKQLPELRRRESFFQGHPDFTDRFLVANSRDTVGDFTGCKYESR